MAEWSKYPLPFDLGLHSPASEYKHRGWEHLPTFEYLRLLKLLQVEQRDIAAHLGATVSSVSMWGRGHRAIPEKYRASLAAYANARLRQAVETLREDTATLPARVRQDAEAALLATIERWFLEGIERDGTLQRTLYNECRLIGSYADADRGTERWSRQERHELLTLCRTMSNQLRVLDALDTAGDTTEERPEPDADVGAEA